MCVMYLRVSDASVICRVTFFSFQFSLLFFHIRQPGSTAANALVYAILDIGRCRKFG